MISIKSEREIDLIRTSGHFNYLTHELIKKNIRPGITTKQLDKIAYDFMIKNGCTPSCLNYEGYPATICASINDEVVHGIPSNRKLKNGDIISIDFGVIYKGYHSDSARTYIVGDTKEEVKALVDNTEKALYIGLQQVKNGAKIGDIGAAIQEYAESHGLGVVRELVGHGVGANLHEDPDVPNYGTKGTGITLKTGMVIAIEPMLTLGEKDIWLLDDDWTIVTQDGLPSAHFEHTVLVTEDGYEILTKERVFND